MFAGKNCSVIGGLKTPRGGMVTQLEDQEIEYLTSEWLPLCSNFGQVVHTCLPLSRSSMILYGSNDSDVL